MSKPSHHEIIMAIIRQAQSSFIANYDKYDTWNELLNSILAFTQSKFGLIGDIPADENG